MIHINFDPQTLPANLKVDWDALQVRAIKATDNIIEKWERDRHLTSNDFDSTVWRDIKQFLMDNVFHHKCAYCETSLTEARQDADAEHFRPKLAVNYKEKPEQSNRKYIPAKVVDVSQNPPEEIDHPGYFWLAYNWKNLLPACRYCNSKDGKKNQFPVAQSKFVFLVRMTDTEAANLISPPRESKKWPGIRYLDFDDIDKLEERYLLHPYWDVNPSKHIGFDEYGKVFAREVNGQESPVGVNSISTYDLWNAGLDTARQKEQERVNSIFRTAIAYFKTLKGKSFAEAKQDAWHEDKIVQVKSGETAYSRAALDYLDLSA